MTQLQSRLLTVLIFVMCGLRFWQLETVPPGFYIDEAGGATNVICISQEGTSETGVSHPLFFPDFDVGGFFTPTYVYFGALWVKAFGTSIQSFRAIAAFFTLLTILGLFHLSRVFLKTEGALLVALAACVSPWSFQFSRIAWDPPLMPCFIVWGLFYFVQPRFWHAAVSGVLFSLAFYAYPTARLQLPLIFPLLVGFKFLYSNRPPAETQGNRISPLLFCITVFFFLGVTSVPLVALTLDGTLSARAGSLSVFNKTYSGGSNLGALTLFLKNLVAHLSPHYLFLSGDANRRHSTGLFGEFSWLDDYAVLLALLLALGLLTSTKKKISKRRQRTANVFLALSVFSAWGFVAGIIPAALTWEGIPHALRSIGSWPFLSLFTGAVLWRASTLSRIAAHFVVIVSLAFALVFGYRYFTAYPEKAGPWFDSYVKEAALEAKRIGNWTGFAQQLAIAEGYAPVSLRYYMIHYGGMSCSESRRTFTQ